MAYIRYKLKVACLVGFLVILLASCNQKSTEARVSEWISGNAIPINTVMAGNGFEDLLPLGEIVGDARMVSLGEPTHGNSEVFQLKHRIVEYLVTRHGFNLFALECPFAEAFDVNKYILEGMGTPEEALAGIYFWTWDTKEVVELLKWMYTYNADPSNKNKVRFYGFDIQDPERAARYMFEYLKKVDPGLAQEVLPELNILQIPFSEPKSMGRRPYIPQEYDEESFSAIQMVMNQFETNRQKYISSTDSIQYELASQHARQVELWVEANRNNGQNYLDVRERGQAENLKWILGHQGESSRAIVWAHNSHVANASPKNYDLMGKYLKKQFGDQLKIFGFFFNQGGFLALDVDVPSTGARNFFVGPAPKGYLEYSLASAGISTSAFDMNQIPSSGPVHEWFHTNLPTRHSGSGYNLKREENYIWSYIPAEAYDVLVFLDSTKAVQPINRANFEALWLLDKKLERYKNLDFEYNQPGETPMGWLTWAKFQRLGVKVEVTEEEPYQGKKSVRLHRPSGVTFGELTPNLTQTIDATPFRGKKIKVSAATRSLVTEPGFAFFRLVIEPDVLQSAHDGLPPLFDSLDNFRINSSEWKIQEIEAEVPEAAHSIGYGIYLRDFGTVWLDDVKVEVLK